MQTATSAHVCTPGRVPIVGDLVLESEAQATTSKHKAPITLDGPYPKRSRRVTRALRTWRVGLALVIVTLLVTCTWQSLRHFMG